MAAVAAIAGVAGFFLSVERNFGPGGAWIALLLAGFGSLLYSFATAAPQAWLEGADVLEERLGLRYRGMRLTGELEGRFVAVSLMPTSDERSNDATYATRVSVSGAPPGFRLWGHTKQSALTTPRNVETGDPDFDARIEIGGSDTEAFALLDHELRARLRQPPAELLIFEGRVILGEDGLSGPVDIETNIRWAHATSVRLAAREEMPRADRLRSLATEDPCLGVRALAVAHALSEVADLPAEVLDGAESTLTGILTSSRRLSTQKVAIRALHTVGTVASVSALRDAAADDLRLRGSVDEAVSAIQSRARGESGSVSLATPAATAGDLSEPRNDGALSLPRKKDMG